MQNVAFKSRHNDSADMTPDERLALVSADLTVGRIHDAVIAAYDPHVVNLSEYAPLGSKGTELHIHTTENLRDILCALGWEKADVFQVPCVVSRTDGVRVACSTDGGPSVGIDYPCKPLLRVKGKGTIRLAGHKGDETMQFPGFEQYTADDDLTKIDDLDFYYLLMHLDEEREEIRLELSRPIFDEKGCAVDWGKRIILPAVSTTNEPPVDTKTVPAPEIEIVRKAS